MKSTIVLFLSFILTIPVFSQDSTSVSNSISGQSSGKADSPYKTSWKVDGPVIAGTLGLNFLGLSLIKNKEGLTETEVMYKRAHKSDVNGIDRFAAGNYSENADKLSYYPFYASFAMPVAMLLNKKIGSKAGQVMAMYVETMAVTGAVYSITAGSVNRSRPYVYGSETPLDKSMKKGARRSFFAGHTAATASATFFAAKVYSDFNPDSRAKPYVWAAAAVVPAVVGYYRVQSGNHFLTDNLLGYAVGAGAGILVPQLHKKGSSNNLSVVPVTTPEYRGLNLSYTF
ncbi:phosphatase PAP2 family protein [Desertivirga arenae]|uniref:phosphatase PAP2 family protein n=1 Tax=Desertivirga arenae TaxID=2810309 RepID=UPI001A95DF70|nr:phosphatase PAP2 family protein [Pedobacter sp. SYSU D00823]